MTASRRGRVLRRRKAYKVGDQLAVPLFPEQIRAAIELHDRLGIWKISKRVRLRLKRDWPGFSEEACLIKAIFINSLYATRIFAIARMAAHVHKVVRKSRHLKGNYKLVERIAAFRHTARKNSKRRYLSFASKFAHFFVDEETLPILDKYAIKMLRHHLGRRNYYKDRKHPYKAYVSNFQKLYAYSGWQGAIGDLDHYLWIAGQYRAFRKNRKAQVNSELKTLLTNKSPYVWRKLKVLHGEFS